MNHVLPPLARHYPRLFYALMSLLLFVGICLTSCKGVENRPQTEMLIRLNRFVLQEAVREIFGDSARFERGHIDLTKDVPLDFVQNRLIKDKKIRDFLSPKGGVSYYSVYEQAAFSWERTKDQRVRFRLFYQKTSSPADSLPASGAIPSPMKKIILLPEKEKSQRQSILRAMLKELGFSNIRDFQKAKGLTADGYVGTNTFTALYAAFLPTFAVNFEGCYYPLSNDKNQIVLHHAAGWNNARKMFDSWRIDDLRHVATAIGISGDGAVIKGFDEEHFAVHIGAYNVGLPNYLALEAGSIGCELANWGALQQRNGQCYAWINDYGKRGTGVTIPANRVIKLGYKDVDYYEQYTPAQIESLRRWLMLQAIRFNIPLRYEEKAFWQVSPDAIAGKAGLYTHNSFIEWKTDISPQPAIIAMLKQFNTFATA